jgi:choline dehydrogenase-like flavoprotein
MSLFKWIRRDRDADAGLAGGMAALRAAAVQLGIASFEAGARQERERVEAIARLAHAYRFPRLALDLVKDPFITVETAAEALEAEAQREDFAVMAQPAESPTFEDGRAPTFH